MSERPRLGAHGIDLPTSITSDWRLVLQDSISQDALQKGCISLFDQIDTDLPLSETEMNHAVRFLEYATRHIKYRGSHHDKLLETILPEDGYRPTDHSPALLKLVCHPSNTLRTVALSLLDASISKSFPTEYRFAATVARLLPHLLERLKPHEIPLNGTTFEFHRHIISILDNFFSISLPVFVLRYYELVCVDPHAKTQISEKLESIFKPSFVYLRGLVDSPVCPTDILSGIILLSDTRQFREIVKVDLCRTIFPEVQRFFREIRTDIVKELTSILGFPSTTEVELCLHYDHADLKTTEHWLKGFEYLLFRVSEGTPFSDLGTLAVTLFMSYCPSKLKLFFHSDDKFGLKMKDKIVSSSLLDVKSLWTLFTPTQPQHAATVLTAFSQFMNHQNSVTVEKHIWSDWFPSFIKAVDPSQLPFTGEFIELHTILVKLLIDHLAKIQQYEDQSARTWTDQLRNELDEAYRVFYTHTKDYVVHLSLHPFALDDLEFDTIIDFLRNEYLDDFENSLNKPYREDARKAMDVSSLASSSPPFILTSQLVCSLPHDEMLNVVDRIVALLESDSCLDDDTILRINAFYKHQLSRVHLPDLFRKAGRSTEQYIHAFECLLSFPIDCFDQSPIKHLLTTRWVNRPTLDRWDDVCFERVGIVKRLISQNNLPITVDSNPLNELLFRFVFGIMPHAHHCAARLCQSQLDRLLAPSVDFLCEYFIHPPNSTIHESQERKKQFVDVFEFCDQRVIAQCLNRTGFFSRFVAAMFDHNCSGTVSCFKTIINCVAIPELVSIKKRKSILNTIPNFLEEGLQDALEFLFVKNCVASDNNRDVAGQMLTCCGANIDHLRGWVAIF
ncbi:hypothetical protein BLNAU_18901 [Blattamonas nauphoetae]|uniref:Uncharacterized protein n=1 Tax=Blattamonas nauphoetae TaxID=2049346 RepID=A0ABQ9X324_9EUKA|nr:hypothetical protein BLNAU_18901 [Blattamonas nauphoetae]